MKARLNKRAIDEATYQGPGGCYLWDTELAAFGVRIYPTGRKAFVVSYWSRGRRRFHTLGQYGRMTLPQAREAALEVFLRVRRGEDPRFRFSPTWDASRATRTSFPAASPAPT